ncbi:NAD-dependent epimerase/dehydratase family protein [Micromonospora aurantiaca]|uniref:NAD-dependent epimerase/dehydratase family protein n=2 Tax=Micromonospora aurantiaca (nom. illeg.) TaxID=47850 RepID=A0ABQ6U7F2_9ACTN|nr:NAD-dependent epimerase/dehydratase family protein [Micromonospora aurantiaca]
MKGSLLFARSLCQIEQLIGRTPAVDYSAQTLAGVTGQRFLVTGAGGSIGSEIVRQLVSLGAGDVYLLDHNEGALHALQLGLHGDGLLQDKTVILADVREKRTLGRIFADVGPTTVFHAAAHKHLPLMERFPSEAVHTNVVGTANVACAAAASGTKRFVNLSTDKAVAPSCILGATKRAAELVAAAAASPSMKVASVRFGNVLGSSGSFLQTVHWQLTNGRAVTVTDRRATRYFMTISEAARLVIEVSAMARNGETYMLDMGEPVAIEQLVHRYAQILGVTATIEYTGLRPGEKLHEDLFDDAENRSSTTHPGIWQTKAVGAPPADLGFTIRGLADAVEAAPHSILQLLWSMMPAGAVREPDVAVT